MTGLSAAGLALHVAAWHLPHAALPEVLAGRFAVQLPRALRFQAKLFRRIVHTLRPPEGEPRPTRRA